MEDTLVPIVMFAVVGLIFSLLFYFRYRSRTEVQRTLRIALEKGAELSPEMLDRLSEPQPSKDRDLRRGLIWLALAIGLALCGFATPDPSGHALRGCLAGAAFPLMIGIAYMIMWRYAGERDRASQA